MARALECGVGQEQKERLKKYCRLGWKRYSSMKNSPIEKLLTNKLSQLSIAFIHLNENTRVDGRCVREVDSSLSRGDSRLLEWTDKEATSQRNGPALQKTRNQILEMNNGRSKINNTSGHVHNPCPKHYVIVLQATNQIKILTIAKQVYGANSRHKTSKSR